MIVIAIALSIFLGALGTFIIRVATAYAKIKKANHKDKQNSTVILKLRLELVSRIH